MSNSGYGCPDVLALLDDFGAGELLADDAKKFAAHLEACASCRAALRVHEGISALVRRADARHAPQELRQRVLEALREEDRRRPD